MSRMQYSIESRTLDEDDRKGKQWPKISLICICIVALIIALVTGLVLYFRKEKLQARTGIVVECLPNRSLTKEECEKNNCVWQNQRDKHVPRCRAGYKKGYKLVNVAKWENQTVFHLERSSDYYSSRMGKDITKVKVVATNIASRIVRIQIIPETASYYTIPDQLLKQAVLPQHSVETSFFVTAKQSDEFGTFGVKVFRMDEDVPVFNTDVPGLTITKQFCQVTSKLRSANIYGFATNDRLKLDMNWKKVAIFADEQRDTHPFHMNIEESGNASGVFLRNSNALEIALQPDPFPAITYRTTGGILDFYVFIGPTPKDVLSQFLQVVGRPFLPPRWSLGLHIGGHHDNVTELHDLVQRNYDAGILFDALHTGPSMRLASFTLASTIRDTISDLLTRHQARYVHVSAAAIKYDTRTEVIDEELMKNTTIKKPDNEVFVSKVDGMDVVYPDYTNKLSKRWFYSSLARLPNQSHGLFLDDNQPYSSVTGACSNNDLNDPPFLPSQSLSHHHRFCSIIIYEIVDGCKSTYLSLVGEILGLHVLPETLQAIGSVHGQLSDNTVCMDAVQSLGSHYDLHNLYGHSQTQVAHRAAMGLRKERVFVASVSSFPGTQQHAAHWAGTTFSGWRDLKSSLTKMLSHSMLGFTMSGSDMCGLDLSDKQPVDAELCLRWVQLSAFSTLTRSYTKDYAYPKDPASFGEASLTAMRSILLTRYKLIPYLYTLMYRAHTHGSPTVSPLFMEFPDDSKTWAIDEQFMWGPGILISPATAKGQTTVDAYFPRGDWFSYFTGAKVSSVGEVVKLDTPVDRINVHVRGGTIIPCTKPQAFSRNTQTEFVLLVAVDSEQKASGQLYWDDGISLNAEFNHWNFTAQNNALTVDLIQNLMTSIKGIGRVELFGLSLRPSSLLINGKESINKLQVYKQGYSVDIQPPKMTFNLTWTFF